MIEIDLFITALFFHADNFCIEHPLGPQPGPNRSLTASEAITLLIFSQWARFRSERDFYRFADTQLRYAFPDLPSREQLNRQWRSLHDQVCIFFSYLADLLEAGKALYEALDATAVVTRDAKRRGDGWLLGQADIGHSNRLGWYEGLKLLLATTPCGIITGFGIAPASNKEQPMAETFFYLRAHPASVWLPLAEPEALSIIQWTRALRVERTKLDGRRSMELASYILPSATARNLGPRNYAVG